MSYMSEQPNNHEIAELDLSNLKNYYPNWVLI